MAWRRAGSTVYFADPSGHLVSVSIEESPTVHIGRATAVAGAPDGIIDLDAAAAGRLLIVRSETREQRPLELVQHWTAAVSRR